MKRFRSVAWSLAAFAFAAFAFAVVIVPAGLTWTRR